METVSQAEFARVRGVSRQYVSKLVKSRKIELTEDGRIDPAAANAAIEANSDLAREGVKAQQQESGQGTEFHQYRTERERVTLERASIELEKERGNLLPKDQILDAITTGARKIRQGMDALPGLAENLETAAKHGGADAIRSLLRSEVRKLETLIATSLTEAIGLEDDGDDEED